MSSIKQIAEEYTDTVWNHQDLGAIDKFIHKDAVLHSLLGNFQGRDTMKGVVQTWLKGFPDMALESKTTICEDDLVSMQWEAQATHRGTFKGREPTGKSVSYGGVTMYRIQEEKIVEYWAYLDMQHLFNQL